MVKHDLVTQGVCEGGCSLDFDTAVTLFPPLKMHSVETGRTV